jgi:BirA family biotin operon repressor/biotin-[acetyl-CoA-carboxylase] ligase
MIRSLERLSQAWNGLPLGSPLWFFESVSSTNDVLKQRAEQGAPEGSVVMAATQTRGRGRQGRSWLSLSGQGLYLSVLLRPGWPAADAGLAATMASLATARCLQRFGVGGVTLKWPNDVLARNRKIAGILVEPRIGGNRIAFIVVGVGVNVNHDDSALADVWDGRATSCRLQGSAASVEDVAAGLIRELSELYLQAREGGADDILGAWLALRAPPDPDEN